MCQAAEQATALYISDDWESISGNFSEQSRAETAQTLSLKEVQMLRNTAADKSLTVLISAKPWVLARLRITRM